MHLHVCSKSPQIPGHRLVGTSMIALSRRMSATLSSCSSLGTRKPSSWAIFCHARLFMCFVSAITPAWCGKVLHGWTRCLQKRLLMTGTRRQL